MSHRNIKSSFRNVSLYLLIPLLLWPGYSRPNCCCTMLDCQVQQLTSPDDFLIEPPDWKNLGVVEMAVPEAECPTQQDACPRCRAAAEALPKPAANEGNDFVFAFCKCENFDFFAWLPTRIESSDCRTPSSATGKLLPCEAEMCVSPQKTDDRALQSSLPNSAWPFVQ